MRYNYFYISFFSFIHYTFGLNSVLLLKKWTHYNKDLVKLKARYKYLLECKRSNLVPKHLSKYGTDKLQFYNDFLSRRTLSFSYRFVRSILNLEISDNYKQRKILVSNIFRLSRAIERNLRSYYCNQFFTTQQWSLSKLSVRETSRLNRKLLWNYSNVQCYHHNSNTLNVMHSKNIKNIQYVCSNVTLNSTNDFTISLVGADNPIGDVYDNDFSVSVNLDPSEYEYVPKLCHILTSSY